MKYFLAIVLIAFCLNASAEAQSLKGRKWTYVQMPGDTLTPFRLTFFDSLHGYFIGYRNYEDKDSFGITQYHSKEYIYETSNGGKSWDHLPDSVFGDGRIGSRDYAPAGPIESSIHFASLKDRYVTAFEYKNGNRIIYHSKDYGKTWVKAYISPLSDNNSEFLTTFASNDFLLYHYDSAYIARTTDGGATFPYRIGGSLFREKLWPDSGKDSRGAHLAQPSFIFRDRLHFTLAYDGGSDTTLFPRGFHTLITTNGGYSWEHDSTLIDGIPELHGSIAGTFQYAKGTSDLYLFTGFYVEGIRTPDYYNNYILNHESLNNTNFMYSPDDGRTWTPVNAYSEKRRGYEVVQKNEIWNTIIRGNEPRSYKTPATIIIRTTDNGVTWEADSTSLNTGEFPVDGRIITFSDPRHGWIAGVYDNQTYIFRYDANEQPLSVESSGPYYPFMTVYPIPAKDEVHITIPKDKHVKNVEIYDVMGRQMTTTFTSEGNLATASVRGFPAGCYVVMAYHETGKYSSTVIVGPR